GDDLRRINLEIRPQRLAETDRLRRDDVHQRATLHSGEDDLVDGGSVLLLGEDQASTRAAQRLVRCSGNDVAVRDRRWMNASGDQSSEVGHVDQIERANFVGDLAHAGEIYGARISAAASDNQLGTLGLGKLLKFVVVDGLGFLGHAVRNDLVRLAGKIQGMAVGEVSAVREVQAEDGIAGLDERRVGRHVGGRAGVRLHVGVLGSEELLGAVTREVLDYVGEFASAVVTLAGISLGVLVREHGAGGFEDSLADEVLGGDEFEAFVLAAFLILDGLRDLRVGLCQRKFHGIGFHDCVLVCTAAYAGDDLVSSSRSVAMILSTRRPWRPPAKGVASHLAIILNVSSSLVMRAPNVSTLASLCSRDNSASDSLTTRAARMPGTLLAAIDIPMPVPQTRMPKSALCAATSSATACA